jgi:cytidylate kinase
MQHKSREKVEKKKIVICISGMAGSGKSTAAKRLAEHYGLKYYSGGDALKAIATDMGYKTTGEGWWETTEGIKFLRERLGNPEIDRKVDEKLLEWANQGGVILDSWTMPWLLKKGFKIWLETSEKLRAQHLAERDGLSLEEALKILREKETKTKAIFMKLYGFKLGEDFKPFQLILDANLLSKDEVYKALLMVINNLVEKGTDS